MGALGAQSDHSLGSPAQPVGSIQGEIVRQPLTARQREALDFITHCLDARGYPPTLREIGEHMGIRSTNGVNDHLKALERKGYLVREELKSRALRPVDFDDAKVTIPILGRVAAGQPILATEQAEDRVVVDRFFLGSNSAREVFGLVVRGDSMIDDGIFDGDYIFVRKQSTAESGEIVVVLDSSIRAYHTRTPFDPEYTRYRLDIAPDQAYLGRVWRERAAAQARGEEPDMTLSSGPSPV